MLHSGWPAWPISPARVLIPFWLFMNIALGPSAPIQGSCWHRLTITSFIVQVALGDLPHGSVGYQTIFAAGLTLMLLTLSFNLLGYWLRRKFREAY